ncbi:MAG: ceramidase domain-containing protein [Paracoccaceae bacterium]
MSWTAPVDNYCERLDASFWAEPLNAVTNMAFLVAALLAWRVSGRENRREPLTILLIAIAAAVGVGSFLFHTFATRWAGVADTAPILLFILVYLFAATRRFLRLGLVASLMAPALFIGFAIAFISLWRDFLPSLNGSEGYLPVLVALLVFGAALTARGHGAGAGLLIAAAVFALSLTFRSMDRSVCADLPFGVHFLWHCFNGLLLLLVMLTFIRHGAKSGDPLARRPAQG